MKIVVFNYSGDRGNWGRQATSQNLVALAQGQPAILLRGITSKPEHRGGMLERAMLLARRSMPGFRGHMDETVRTLT